ncbi:16S rRNA (cytidine(1402)-2'-O)-methyltransferase [Roseobacter sp. HKCCD9010]|uniref:16S rRNA (cytidine(1402)-2'-O)-methyltransferase n=1 Tax=unclassified Roseobacter TaxID=196798 RepID=UPI001490AC82|nr:MULTISPECIES: 16S rRNA (cytidine(1402)-2'-O)-methyltransferase [unclassified Roseobacter]MBF9049057.1 16S rRNA (cytidine(1402)-2'-O)-methyltransferase [Rhodobacterales bacterium HKCCD4356]NNV11057.1 16S rRNA (cytidine(1402)-2'-O)-methyltransferase [Roseobacter sp. HKCCD7357]NNV15241.1 16S rRNA (cytidine(1402)-2'-O)-methyltransferase [Roseobacter sp. HKCCD8768]NNV24701.1 16S rRNA (cytidine(1402)-2'-O)-methyltransferase [Roseobacter sp. HKCCD8192]NNV28957.1 16S rRNA (cytidine(1402)-2'-O)-meth
MSDFPAELDPGATPARRVRLAPGVYFVATPIGAARDITLRALDILLSADVIAAEDTRTARKLMELHGVPLGERPLIAYYDHNGPAQRPRLLAALAEGKSLAYVSEAGTPLVADPGYQLGRAAIEAGAAVFAAPGASAALAALSVSGLPSDRFLFAGFPPNASGAQKRWLEGLRDIDATLLLYESPKRIHRLLDNLAETVGADREVALCRELTKRFEEVIRGSVADVAKQIKDRSLKGEIVVVIGRGKPRQAATEDVEAALTEALKTNRVKDAATEVADRFGMPRREIYQLALKLGER